MPAPRVVRGLQLASQLQAAGIDATVDPAELAGRLPAVLVLPPRVSFDLSDGSTADWRLLAVSSTTSELQAWQQLDQLVEAVAAVLPIERAEPSRFAPGPDATPTPAYALTFTDTLDQLGAAQ